MSLSRRELFHVWHEENDLEAKNNSVLAYVMGRNNLDNDNANFATCKELVKNFTSKLSYKWKESNRTLIRFEAKNRLWLDGQILFPTNKTNSGKVGRPSKQFLEASQQTKRLKISSLLHSHSTEELSFAASSSLYKSGHRDAASLVRKIVDDPSEIAASFKQGISIRSSLPKKYTPEEALALFIDAHLTKHTYQLMKAGAKLRNADIYPSYHVLQKTKETCYPDKSQINVSETCAEIKLQALVDHTCRRILSVQETIFFENSSFLSEEFTILYKWGCDGSAGHPMYKQKYSGEGSQTQSDAFLFAVCLVPLRLQSKNTILWNNPRPSSTRFCRPIKLIYEKETTELSKKEISSVQNQISAIRPTSVLINNQTLNIKHDFKLTMIDGKMFSVITESSNQTCAICGATPKDMNNIEKILKRISNKDYLEFGMSTLHAWIRCFEVFLHISYRVEVRKWQIRETNDKEIVSHRKNIIRNDLRKQMGLLVDIPKPGFGTTNDGNTARRFFQQPSLAASITGIDENLIYRFSVILKTLSSGYTIHIEKFREYARETAERYVELYSWYYMPSTVHKILIHGADIIKVSGVPVGILSEEAIESRNKDFKKYREHNSRKTSREKTMEDLLHYLLFSSDPKISILSKSTSPRYRKKESFDQNVINLLMEPTNPLASNSFDISDENTDMSSCASDSDCD